MSWKLIETVKSSWIGRPLSTLDLERAIHLPHFGGVWSRNHLFELQPSTYPQAYVINTDDDDGPGKHWTVFWCERPGEMYFFDSYGCPPAVYGRAFADFSTRHGYARIQHQPKWLQSLTSFVCGHYCLYFLCHSVRCLDRFGSDQRSNDMLVNEWTRHHFPFLFHSTEQNSKQNSKQEQICCSFHR